MCRFLGKTAVRIQLPPKGEFISEEWQESCRPVNTFLTFEGDSESLLHSTYIHNTSLLPKMSTRPWQDPLFVLWPWCKTIRVHTPPDLIDTFHVNTEAESLVASNLKPRVILAPCKASMIVCHNLSLYPQEETSMGRVQCV